MNKKGTIWEFPEFDKDILSSVSNLSMEVDWKYYKERKKTFNFKT